MERRQFLKKSGAATTLLSAGVFPGGGFNPPYRSEKDPLFVGIQMGAHSFYDEGIERVLDFLANEVAVNVLMFYSHTY